MFQVLTSYPRLARVVAGYYRWHWMPPYSSDLIVHLHVSSILMVRHWRGARGSQQDGCLFDSCALKDHSLRSAAVEAGAVPSLQLPLEWLKPTSPRSLAVARTVQIRVASCGSTSHKTRICCTDRGSTQSGTLTGSPRL